VSLVPIATPFAPRMPARIARARFFDSITTCYLACAFTVPIRAVATADACRTAPPKAFIG